MRTGFGVWDGLGLCAFVGRVKVLVLFTGFPGLRVLTRFIGFVWSLGSLGFRPELRGFRV